MAQTVNVTGGRLTSAETTFTIEGFAREKESGDYGNCLTSQVAFTSGHLDKAKSNGIIRARKSLRQWKQLRGKPEFPMIPARRESQVAAASTRD